MPPPANASDKVYVGSVWRVTSPSAKPAIKGKWELLITERKGNGFKGEARMLNGDSRNKRQIYGTVKLDGSVSIAALSNFVRDLPNPGRLVDGKITFAPQCQRPRYANNAGTELRPAKSVF